MAELLILDTPRVNNRRGESYTRRVVAGRSATGRPGIGPTGRRGRRRSARTTVAATAELDRCAPRAPRRGTASLSDCITAVMRGRRVAGRDG